jgi:hypothetical protein
LSTDLANTSLHKLAKLGAAGAQAHNFERD